MRKRLAKAWGKSTADDGEQAKDMAIAGKPFANSALQFGMDYLVGTSMARHAR